MSDAGAFRATREAVGAALVHLGHLNERVVVLDADLSRSTCSGVFAGVFPRRFYNLGIAEQNLFGVAAGMAREGFVPFAVTYAIFVGRGFDQIRQSIVFARANVKIIATHGGLAASYDGGSHQCLEDISLMRVLPEMVVVVPTDYNQACAAICVAAEYDGPFYIRLQKEPVRTLHASDCGFEIGRMFVHLQGRDLVLLANGAMVWPCIEASKFLRNIGIAACVAEMATIKPIDKSGLGMLASKFDCFVVVEEHSVIGGLYEAVAASLSSLAGVRVYSISTGDQFGTTGSWLELRASFGLTAHSIEAFVRSIFAIV